jgi:hypothetical protein
MRRVNLFPRYILKIARKNCRETIVREIFEGNVLDAERRLAELWNQHAAHDGNDRYRATMTEFNTRRLLHSIN